MLTREDMFDYNVQQAIKKFKDQLETDPTGEDLINEIYDNTDIFGEIMMEVIQQSLGDEVFE